LASDPTVRTFTINFHSLCRLPRLSSGVILPIDLLSARSWSARSPSHQPFFYYSGPGTAAPIHCRDLRWSGMEFPPPVKRGRPTNGRTASEMRWIAEKVRQKFLNFVRYLREFRDATTPIPLQNEIHQKFIPTSNRTTVTLQSSRNDPPNQLWNDEKPG
jgi:hypothetical protein